MNALRNSYSTLEYCMQIFETEVQTSGLGECKSVFACTSSNFEWETSLGTGVKSECSEPTKHSGAAQILRMLSSYL